MRLSRYLLPTLKETPAEAQIVSHRTMLRAGMIKQTSSGIYAWLPLGYRVLQNIAQIVREEQDRFGALELLMPTIQPADIWRESGRYDDYGKEMLRIRDRHDRDLLYGPTNEEMITDIFRTSIRSYKDLPQRLYHIQWKFRDEIRPRFGVMRGREFLMKDAYSFDLDAASARTSYNSFMAIYFNIFSRMGLQAVPVRADTGPIGGDLSHEFHILADTGESELFVEQALLDKAAGGDRISPDSDLAAFVDTVTSHYAAADELHDPATCPTPPDELVTRRGIEIGHIFLFGTKYSKAMNAVVANRDGDMTPVEMGSYGVGVSRLVGGIIEASHDEAGIIWPDTVAPFDVGLINLKVGDDACEAACASAEQALKSAGVSVLHDDRAERPGAKFANMDLIGLPWQLIVGPRGLASGVVELKRRSTGERQELSLESALARLAEHKAALIKRHAL